MELHLAQVNVATLLHPDGDPRIRDFVDGLGPVNQAGDSAPGFVWRLQTAEGDATQLRVFPDPLTIVNLTVWESLSDLRAFAYDGLHRDYLRRRREWFAPQGSAHAMWWVAAGTTPTIDDAKQRLDFIERFGPSPFAFRMGQAQAQLVVGRADIADPGSQSLINALNRELSARYPEPGANHFTLHPEQVAPGAGGFFTAHLDGRPVACGAYRRLDGATAEVKRMYVDPTARGLKVGAAMLATLEAAAVFDGITRLVLETGTRQHEAVGLYERFGFGPVPCWGEYADTPTSICFGKLLA